MTDQLQRAWALLTDDERPRGMEWWEGEDIEPCLLQDQSLCTDEVAYDRLCQAVEGVVKKKYLWFFGFNNGEHHVMRKDPVEVVVVHVNPDRLTAACDALEAERGKS